MLGAKTATHYVVEAGLGAGEKVVTEGAFALDSAMQVQAKKSMMEVLDKYSRLGGSKLPPFF